MGTNFVNEFSNKKDRTVNFITMLFFAQPIVKYIYFGSRSKLMLAAFESWDEPNSNPLFDDSNARYRASAISKMRKVLSNVMIASILTIICWIGITFFEEPYRMRINIVTNESWYEEVIIQEHVFRGFFLLPKIFKRNF